MRGAEDSLKGSHSLIARVWLDPKDTWITYGFLEFASFRMCD